MTNSIRPTGSISSSVSRAGQDAFQRGAKGNPVLGLFALLAMGTTVWMMHDTYQGNHEREEQEAEMHRAQKDYAYAAFDWGRWSGQPKMDNLAHSWMGLKLYGPYGLKEQFQEAGVKVHSIWKEVIMPNLIPLGISVASLYGYFGAHAINSKFAYVGKKLGGVVFQEGVGNSITKYANKGFKGTVNGAASVLRKAFKHPGVATGLLFLGAYGLKRFNDAYSGQGQREYFRNELWGMNGMEE